MDGEDLRAKEKALLTGQSNTADDKRLAVADLEIVDKVLPTLAMPPGVRGLDEDTLPL